MQAVRKFLPANKVYLPADVKRWTPDTSVCDLEVGRFPSLYLAASQICLMLGVVEYIADVATLFQRLAPRISHLLVTYSTTESHPARHSLWVNHFSEPQFKELLTNAGFAIEERHFIADHRQVLFRGARKKAMRWTLIAPAARLGIGLRQMTPRDTNIAARTPR
jgi:hypothetical protein